MKMPAQTAVARVRMLPAPRPPKTCCALPPNAAPMPPPLPCCRSTTSMRNMQTEMWTMSSSVVSIWFLGARGVFLEGELAGGEGFGRLRDGAEGGGVEACTADEGAGHVGGGGKIRRGVGVGGT